MKGSLVLIRHDPKSDILAQLARTRGVGVLYTRASDKDFGKSRSEVLLLEQGPAASGVPLKTVLPRIKGSHNLVLLLDGITDPQNLGAILRSADGFGVEFVVLPSRRAAHETEIVGTVSAGASAWVNVVIAPNLSTVIAELKKREFWVYGGDIRGKPLEQVDFRRRVALILGSEGKGMSRLVQKSCDELVRIPALGHIESLNVSVAAGILMYEIRRQQAHED